MSEIVRMPELTGGMAGGIVLEWKKKVGDFVNEEELFVLVETDKATFEFEARISGILLYIGVEKGATVKVNEVLAVIGKLGENAATLIARDDFERLKEK